MRNTVARQTNPSIITFAFVISARCVHDEGPVSLEGDRVSLEGAPTTLSLKPVVGDYVGGGSSARC